MPAAISDAELKRTMEALAKHRGNQTHAGQELGLAQNTVRQRLMAARRRGIVASDEEAGWNSRESYHAGRRKPETSDECEAVLNDWLGRKKAVPKSRTIVPKTGTTKRIVIASDFHAPFHDPWAVNELIVREAKQTDVLIIGGDFTDSYTASRFPKSERVTAQQEWAACDALLSHLSRHFNEIVCIEGNHDMRLERYLRATVPPDIMWQIEQLAGGSVDPFKAIARKYPNVSFQSQVAGRHDIGWLAQFGDLIIAHAEKYSKVPMSALRTIDEWLTNQDLVLKLKPWKVLAQGHTHAGGVNPWKADKLLVETGCLCETHGYMFNPRISGTTQRRGYVRLKQSAEGKTDINSVHFEWLDAERPAESIAS